MTVVPISKVDAIEAVRAAAFATDEGRTIVHAMAVGGGLAIGADWDLDDVVAFIESVDDSSDEHPQIGWVSNLFDHDLMVVGGNGRIRSFAVKAPEGTL